MYYKSFPLRLQLSLDLIIIALPDNDDSQAAVLHVIDYPVLPDIVPQEWVSLQQLGIVRVRVVEKKKGWQELSL